MSVYKRKDSPHWWIRYTSPGGTVVRVSAQTADRKAASQLEAKMRAEDWNHQKLGKCPRVYWPVAVERFLEEKQAGRGRPWVDALYKLRNLHPHLGALRLDEIDADCLARFVVIRRSHGVSNATINRELEVVRAILKQAHVWGILQSVPAVHKLSEPKRRVRFLTRAEADRLLSELSGELRAMVLFSLATGLREHNVTHLEWSQVDLERRIAWIHADQFKTRKALAVPLNADASAVLRGQVGRDEVRVFTLNNGNTRSWQQALVRAGIVDCRWHDLRHTWASWHVQAGTPLNALQELGGWSSYDMVRRYAAFGAGHLAEYAENVSGPRLVNYGHKNDTSVGKDAASV